MPLPFTVSQQLRQFQPTSHHTNVICFEADELTHTGTHPFKIMLVRKLGAN